MQNREAKEGRGFLMPSLPAVVIAEAQFHVRRQDATLAFLFHYCQAVKSPLAGISAVHLY